MLNRIRQSEDQTKIGGKEFGIGHLAWKNSRGQVMTQFVSDNLFDREE
jgi:hypothetical protein